jgi:hypothetical protein
VSLLTLIICVHFSLPEVREVEAVEQMAQAKGVSPNIRRTTMPRFLCLSFAIVGACVFGAVVPVAPLAQAANTMEIIIDNGPHAGTYKLPAANTICIHAKERKQFSAAYKDITALDPKVLSGAGINVFNPDDAGPRHGQINIRFGDPEDKRPALYEAFVPRDSKGSLTLTRKDLVVDLVFEGETKNGVKLRAMAKCGDIDEF